MGVSGAGSSTSKSSSSSSRSSSSASKTSAARSATRSATSTKTANAQKKSSSRPTGYSRRDSFSLPECKVTPVKGGRTSGGTGVGNDSCTFNPRDSWEA